jgi:hypothetical protein
MCPSIGQLAVLLGLFDARFEHASIERISWRIDSLAGAQVRFMNLGVGFRITEN